MSALLLCLIGGCAAVDDSELDDNALSNEGSKAEPEASRGSAGGGDQDAGPNLPDGAPPATDSGPPEKQSPSTSVGFTPIKPSADSRRVYVSSSTGKDTNDCASESTPCKTLLAGMKKLRQGFPDHLYLKRGDTWRDEAIMNQLPSGRSATEPLVVTSYGTTGARPKIESGSGNTSLRFQKEKVAHVHVIGLEFSAYKLVPGTPSFDGTSHADIMLLGGHSDFLFEDNKFSFIELVMQNWTSGSNAGNPSNIRLRRNIWTGTYYNESSFNQDNRPSNIYASSVSGLTIEENVLDHGGWHPTVPGAGANMYNHNIYVQVTTDGSKLLLKNNIITRASSHGAQLRGGGLAEDNFFARNTVGLMLGYWEPIPTGVRAHAFDNVISEGIPMVRGNAACTGNNLCTGALWGLEFSAMGFADWRGERNIISHVRINPESTAKYGSLSRASVHTHKDQASTVQLNGNLAYKWTNNTEGVSAQYPDPERTLGSYNQSLGGANSFEAFMDVVLNRAPATWDERYTASAINKYIRAGFKK